ncbi:Far10p NDAI_0G02140 [Naumovozyma dairenensis CBS 421]|uniref:FHA domain-containing protein n=1 Tax=Naumovozyma dairenensis (strain ATCC 10597 / BCRC 20456 / CBS 421 / NBRC 0211 / NRRL Y-12639) TaxID=1071378 RepID=G0WDX8_NAUDC|nr:hypothetical protein NDAI_0G02140 [Naumovozyma dairenensis CBS 421]CCD25989.2 hypothetical protein NDAI_0G02140 [Naumovozyma dairenensis CBS 421]
MNNTDNANIMSTVLDTHHQSHNYQQQQKDYNSHDHSHSHSHHHSQQRQRQQNNKSMMKDGSLPSHSIRKHLKQQERQSYNVTLKPREKYTKIMVLKSLNSTFDTKYLIVPFKPNGLKFGRPVANPTAASNAPPQPPPPSSSSCSSSSNNNNNNNNNASIDLSATSCSSIIQVRQDNGYFDSRVLSRNHALLSCNPTNGSIYIKDLKSSNGTFVNGERLTDSQDKELNIGDVLDLGTDIDTKFDHRKISAFIEDIFILPLVDNDDTTTRTASSDATTIAGDDLLKAGFETTLFGDVVDEITLEETLFGSDDNNEILSGIFINNSIGTNKKLIDVIKSFGVTVSLNNHQLLTAKSVETFLMDYSNELDKLHKLLTERNDKHLSHLQNNLRQALTKQQESLMKDHQKELNDIENDQHAMEKQFKLDEIENNNRLKEIELELEDLRTRLEVERYKNSQLLKDYDEMKEKTKEKQQDGDTIVVDTETESKTEKPRMDKEKHATNDNRETINKGSVRQPCYIDKGNKREKTYSHNFLPLFTLGAISMGIFAFTLKHFFL